MEGTDRHPVPYLVGKLHIPEQSCKTSTSSQFTNTIAAWKQ